jgi:hypothetical protein
MKGNEERRQKFRKHATGEKTRRKGCLKRIRGLNKRKKKVRYRDRNKKRD